MPVGLVLDAVDTPGEDAVVDPGLAGHGAQQRGIGGFTAEGQAQQASGNVGEVVMLLAFVDALGFEDEAPGGFVLRVQEHIGDIALFDDAAGVHHCHAVADAADHVHFMGDQHDGQFQLAVDLGQQLQHLPGGLRVEGAGGFVAEQQFRAAGQGAGDADALFLAAGKLGRVFACVVGEADALEQFIDTGSDLRGAEAASELHRHGNVVGDGLGGQQVEVLEDHADALAEFA
ncbi:MAG: hypothetical protein GAK45_00887 [Pseudomonas citronellolis]|nr:MAG: hypothetical protein GAK45_00887 [Pseudomonas citronellolis]